MKKNYLFGIVLIFFLIFSAGWITVGKSFSVDPVRQIKIGKTTKQDALTLFLILTTAIIPKVRYKH